MQLVDRILIKNFGLDDCGLIKRARAEVALTRHRDAFHTLRQIGIRCKTGRWQSGCRNENSEGSQTMSF